MTAVRDIKWQFSHFKNSEEINMLAFEAITNLIKKCTESRKTSNVFCFDPEIY